MSITYQCPHGCGEFESVGEYEVHVQREHEDEGDRYEASFHAVAQELAHEIATADTDYSEEFSITLPHSTWLTIWHMCSEAVRSEDVEALEEEFEEARMEFLDAHPEEMFRQ